MREPVLQRLEETANFIDSRVCLHSVQAWPTTFGVIIIHPTQTYCNTVRDFGLPCELRLQNRLKEPSLSQLSRRYAEVRQISSARHPMVVSR
jgi:hypothetical protein